MVKFKEAKYEWLDPIPFNWSVSKLKYFSSIFTGNSLNDSEKSKFSKNENNLSGRVYVSSKDINVNNNSCNYETGLIIPFNETKYKIAPLESSLLCIEGGSAGKKMTFTKQEVCFVNKLACFIGEDEQSSKFIYYYLQSDGFKVQFNSSLSGLIGGVSLTNLNDFKILIPPKETQIRIGKFLDKKTAEIDTIIGKKEMLLLRLEEKKKAIINESVTKGLNPNAPIEDSGIKWIGGIPAHWKVISLKYLVLLNSNEKNEDIEFKLALDNIESWTGKLKSNISSEFEGVGNVFLPGDVLFNKLRPYLAKVCHVEVKGMCVNELLVLTCLSQILSKFLFYRMISSEFIEIVDSSTYGAKMPRANWEFIGNIKIPLPPIQEQKQIILELDKKQERIINLLDKLKIQIEKLKEYRQSLISEAVTGKITIE